MMSWLLSSARPARRTLKRVLALCGLACVSAAMVWNTPSAAQQRDEPPLNMFQPKQNATELRVMPRALIEQKLTVSGIACCSMRPDGGPQCRVVWESHPGLGIVGATERMTQVMEFTEAGKAWMHRHPNAVFLRTFTFRGDPRAAKGPDTELRARVNQAERTLRCEPGTAVTS
jgi:hypothetical protein